MSRTARELVWSFVTPRWGSPSSRAPSVTRMPRPWVSEHSGVADCYSGQEVCEGSAIANSPTLWAASALSPRRFPTRKECVSTHFMSKRKRPVSGSISGISPAYDECSITYRNRYLGRTVSAMRASMWARFAQWWEGPWIAFVSAGRGHVPLPLRRRLASLPSRMDVFFRFSLMTRWRRPGSMFPYPSPRPVTLRIRRLHR